MPKILNGATAVVMLAFAATGVAQARGAKFDREFAPDYHPWAQAPTQAQPHWGRPYAHPGDGDNDGLSRDPDDCNKGCIDGNPG